MRPAVVPWRALHGLVVALCLVVPGALVAQAVQVGLYGVQAELPGGFAPSPMQADDGTGRRYYGPGGARLTLWGMPRQDRSIRAYGGDRRATYEADGGRVDYAEGGDSWFVMSGEARGRIYYLRVENGESCLGEPIWAHLEITYPAGGPERERYDDALADLAGSLSGC